ncbi:CurL C-terminal domain-containing protein [Crossiella sp. CA198]|uniref:CurL C-terminal domain-containing protein n=1 Tax=Crossiella sp. CA198 TaxID=3455607 RepID=UPI003F8D2C7B
MTEQTWLLPLSAGHPAVLAAMRQRLADWLREHPDADLRDVAFTLARGREEFDHRCVVLATGHAQAIEALTAPVSEQRVHGRVGASFLGPEAADPAVSLADRWCQGVPADLTQRRSGRRIHLPGYAFRRVTMTMPVIDPAAVAELAGLTDTVLATASPAELDRCQHRLRRLTGVRPDLAGASTVDAVVKSLADALATDGAGADPDLESVTPLAPVPLRLVFTDQVRTEGRADNNVLATVSLGENPDVPVLQRLFTELQAAEPALRTIVHRDGDRWFAHVRTRPLAELTVAEATTDEHSRAALTEWATTPFELLDAPLVRALVTTRGDLAVLAYRAITGPEQLNAMLGRLHQEYRAGRSRTLEGNFA